MEGQNDHRSRILIFECKIVNIFLPLSFNMYYHSIVGNVSSCRYRSECRTGGCEFDPGTVPYFGGD